VCATARGRVSTVVAISARPPGAPPGPPILGGEGRWRGCPPGWPGPWIAKNPARSGCATLRSPAGLSPRDEEGTLAVAARLPDATRVVRAAPLLIARMRLCANYSNGAITCQRGRMTPRPPVTRCPGEPRLGRPAAA